MMTEPTDVWVLVQHQEDDCDEWTFARTVAEDEGGLPIPARAGTDWNLWLCSNPDCPAQAVTLETYFTAHEPAAPAPPDWWGSKVVRTRSAYYLIFNVAKDHYVDHAGVQWFADQWHDVTVTVIVDRDGNQPAARVRPDAFATERRWREKAEAQVIELHEKRKAAEAESDEWRERYEATLAERDRHRADHAEVVNEGIRQKRRANEAEAALARVRELANQWERETRNRPASDGPVDAWLHECAAELRAALDGEARRRHEDPGHDHDGR